MVAVCSQQQQDPSVDFVVLKARIPFARFAFISQLLYSLFESTAAGPFAWFFEGFLKGSSPFGAVCSSLPCAENLGPASQAEASTAGIQVGTSR